jgi:acyl carrier protein
LNCPQESTLERLQRILANEFEVAADIITPAARLDSLGIDSLAVIEVIFRLEDEFKVSFPQDPGELPTIGDLVAAIDRLVGHQAAQAPSKAEAP